MTRTAALRVFLQAALLSFKARSQVPAQTRHSIERVIQAQADDVFTERGPHSSQECAAEFQAPCAAEFQAPGAAEFQEPGASEFQVPGAAEFQAPGAAEFYATVAEGWLLVALHAEASGALREVEEAAATLMRCELHEVHVKCLQVLTALPHPQDRPCGAECTSCSTHAHALLDSRALCATLLHVACDEGKYRAGVTTTVLQLLEQTTVLLHDVSQRHTTNLLPLLLRHVTHPLETLQCAALSLLGKLLQQDAHISPHFSREVVEQLVLVLEERSGAWSGVAGREACARFLLHITDQLLLLDQRPSLPGDLVLRLWTVLMRLFQDEIATVRELVSSFASQLRLKEEGGTSGIMIHF